MFPEENSVCRGCDNAPVKADFLPKNQSPFN